MMPDTKEFEAKLWKSLRADMTVMIGINGVDPRPMTVQFDGDRKAMYFFTSKDTELAENLKRAKKATVLYAAKHHDLFATLHGTLSIDSDRAVVDRLWNRFVAAWFEQGKDDPMLRLLRFDPTEGQIWLDASSLVAGVKMMVGLGDPKRDYKDSVAKVRLS